jgi:hypothetical protein
MCKSILMASRRKSQYDAPNLKGRLCRPWPILEPCPDTRIYLLSPGHQDDQYGNIEKQDSNLSSFSDLQERDLILQECREPCFAISDPVPVSGVSFAL